MNHRDSMIQLAKSVMQLAYAPYSHFHVGATLRSEDDQFFSGCNIENVSYGMTLCAESSALGTLISSGQKKIVEIAVVSTGDIFCPPCGACRQRLIEFSVPGTLVHLCNARNEHVSMLLDDLLPSAFNKQHLRGNE